MGKKSIRRPETASATCEYGSWCWSADWCSVFDVTYSEYYWTCPDGHEHVFHNRHCTRYSYYMNGTAHR